MDLFGLSPIAVFGLAVAAIVAASPVVVLIVVRGERRRRAMWARVAQRHGLTSEGGVLRGTKYGCDIEVRESVRGTTRGSGSSCCTVVTATLTERPRTPPSPEIRRLVAMRYPSLRFGDDWRVYVERGSFWTDEAWLGNIIEVCARAAYEWRSAASHAASGDPATQRAFDAT